MISQRLIDAACHLLKSRLEPLTDTEIFDQGALVVFADVVLEERWYDDRVMRLVLDIKPLPYLRTEKERNHAKAQAANRARAFHDQFALHASPHRNTLISSKWGRACASVILFGQWGKKKKIWNVVKSRMAKEKALHDRQLKEDIARMKEDHRRLHLVIDQVG